MAGRLNQFKRGVAWKVNVTLPCIELHLELKCSLIHEITLDYAIVGYYLNGSLYFLKPFGILLVISNWPVQMCPFLRQGL
jgi:hypothetical protein